MQDGQKAVWNIPYVSVAFFPSLKQNFIAYRSSKVSSCPDCIFEIHQLWQLEFNRVYSNSCCSRSFEPEIISIGQSSHKMYSNNTVNFQESTTILNVCTKKSGNLLNSPRTYANTKANSLLFRYELQLYARMAGTQLSSFMVQPQNPNCNSTVGPQLLNILIGPELWGRQPNYSTPWQRTQFSMPQWHRLNYLPVWSTVNSQITLFQNLQILWTIASGHDVIHTPALFPMCFF